MNILVKVAPQNFKNLQQNFNWIYLDENSKVVCIVNFEAITKNLIKLIDRNIRASCAEFVN